MFRGSITKLVTTFGSNWGRIRRDDGPGEIFFNAASLEDPSKFSELEVGHTVEFDEQPDYVNGSHAEHVVDISMAVANAGTLG